MTIDARTLVPLYCRCCHRQLALASPRVLLFNVGCVCDEPVALKCASCGARRFWKPVRVIDTCAILETVPM